MVVGAGTDAGALCWLKAGGGRVVDGVVPVGLEAVLGFIGEPVCIGTPDILLN